VLAVLTDRAEFDDEPDDALLADVATVVLEGSRTAPPRGREARARDARGCGSRQI
jgi:hypothetical protein